MQLKTLIHRKLRKAIYRAVVYSSVYELFVQKFSFFPGFLSLPEVDWNIQCDKEDILIDLGANIGDITSRLAKTKAKVYAFEPDPIAFKILSRRFSLIENVICINKGVMANAGQLELYPCNPNQIDRIQASVGSSFVPQKNHTKISFGVVECVGFSDFIYELNKPIKFVQDNHSRSSKGVLRGLHCQMPPHAQGKLVRIIQGEVLDIAVDIRESSPTCGQYSAEILSSDNKKQLYIPEGFAHGFLTLSDTSEFLYKTTDFYHPESERCILWNDATLSIKWPKDLNIQVSPKDLLGQSFKSSELFPCQQ